jgi:hypothetical protein
VHIIDLQIEFSSFGLEKFKLTANRYNIKAVCETWYTPRNSLIRIRPISVPQKTADSVCSIPCQFGRSYIGEQADCGRETWK